MTEQRDSIPGNKYDWRDDWLLALAALIAVVLLLGCSASLLNTQFYKTYSPFFDSAAYHHYLATVVGVFEERGTLEGLNYALGSTTAPLPGLEAIALARLGLVHSPVPRLLGIQLQLIWILVLAGLLFFYWFGFRRVSAWVAVALSLPFIMFTGLFHFNGGLMDFRLDLSLYIFFSITVVCYLMTEHIDSYGIWIGMGFAAAFACLTRATAPVYLVVALGPPWVARMWFASDRAKLLKQTFAMLVPLCLFGLSYFAYNFNHLYYYYVVWSADANANLPWSKSIAHFLYAWRAMGTPLATACILFLVLRLGENFASLRIRQIDWKLLWIGIAPALFLTSRGAGWNPFVAMPSIFGMMLFALAPMKNPATLLRTPLTAIGLVAVTLACGWNLVEAPLRAQPEWPAQMSALRGGIDTMHADAASKGLKEIKFTSIHLWDYHAAFIRDVLLHEYSGRSIPPGIVLPDRTSFIAFRDHDYSPATKLDWERWPGQDDAAKIAGLVADARANLDYLIIPDDDTVTIVEKAVPHNYANLVLRRVKKGLLESSDWKPIGEKFRISPQEAVQIYAKVR